MLIVLAEVTPPLEVGGGGRIRSNGGEDIFVENPTLMRAHAISWKNVKIFVDFFFVNNFYFIYFYLIFFIAKNTVLIINASN